MKPPEASRSATVDALYVGASIGLFEAVAVLRWDFTGSGSWLVDAAWGGAIVILDALGLALLDRLLARSTRRSLEFAVMFFAMLVLAARAWVADRFDLLSLAAVALVLLGLLRVRHWPGAVAAAGVALLCLWGRVPNYALPVTEQLLHHVPGAAAILLVAVLPRSLALRSGVAALALLATAYAGSRHVAEARVTGEPPNLLIVLVDTLRPDRLDPWGGEGAPAIARLAREGARFDEAVTVIPKTTQSVASMQTGRYPVRHGLRDLMGSLAQGNRTLAEVLGANGYDTGAFVHNAWIQRGRGFEQGFREFWSWYEIERPFGPLRYGALVTLLDGLTLRRNHGFDGNTDAAVVTDRALAWLARARRPFYGYVHYFDPHWPYRPPNEDGECLVNNIDESEYRRGQMIFQNTLPEGENRRARELYVGEIRYNMDQIGRLFDYLDSAGLRENTVVVFVADHGHHLGDHAYYYHHGEFLYEPGVRIPLIVRYPKKIAAGTVRSELTRTIDLFPSLLGLMGIAAPKVDGVDVFAAPAHYAFLETDISRFADNERRYVKGFVGNVRGVRSSDYKLVYTPRAGTGVWEMYDLRNDPDEARELIRAGAAPRGELEAMLRELVRWIPAGERAELERLGNRFDRLPDVASAAASPQKGGAADDGASPVDTRLLRSLGYVQ